LPAFHRRTYGCRASFDIAEEIGGPVGHCLPNCPEKRRAVTELYWLPQVADWRGRLRELRPGRPDVWEHAVALANARLDFVLTNALDERIRGILPEPPTQLATRPVRLAVLCSSSVGRSSASKVK
jgi:hypothetical protein